jgi:hypothetical protein
MTEGKTTFQLACEIHERHQVPVFPVLIFWSEDLGKWHKQPLVKWTQVSGDPHDIVWQGANAVGVPMGPRSGLVAIDLDDYKAGCQADHWLDGHKVPPTRVHGTTSGGRHMIFRLPDGVTVGNQAPSVRGVDIRGSGGFIVWADIIGRYKVMQDRSPALLPSSLAEELQQLRKGRPDAPISDKNLPPYIGVPEDRLEAKLAAALAHPKATQLKARFAGLTKGLQDHSASGRDMSVAATLARRGFEYPEIVQILLTLFRHGTAARDGWTERTERAAKRCAYRACEAAKARRDKRRQAMIDYWAQCHARPAHHNKNSVESEQ